MVLIQKYSGAVYCLFISLLVTCITLYSLSTGQIPYKWKIHKIVPVHKSANRSSVTNYHPISLLSNTSKILEQLIYNKVIKHNHMQ